jgi:DNA-binding CsgD family transcriptional regulator/tetratricopeptide (TPR) repeat protein
VLGRILIYQGANRDAETRLTEGLAACRALGDTLHAAIALIELGAVASLRGDQERSAALLEDARATAQAIPDPHLAGIVTGRVLMNLAVIARTRGDYPLATAHLEDALQRERAAGFAAGIIMALADLGDLARDQGDLARALASYRDALDLVRFHPGARVVTEAVEAVGIVAAMSGQAERGARLLGAAEAQRDRIQLRFRVQETLAALKEAVATSRSALGDPAFAAAWAAGRRLTLAQAVAEARDPVPRPVVSGGAVLTPRELEILRLLAAGMTDPAIAAALYISVRTVESHVTRIFVKLDVHTRTAAAAAASAARLVDPGGPSPA